MEKNFCIILAGGVGRRLWPESRRDFPKQFIDFFACGRTLLQETFDRFHAFLPAENIFVSTFKGYVSLVREQLPELPQANILAEPVQLSTAPAVVWATNHIAAQYPEANIIVSPADQHIVHPDRFRSQVVESLRFVAGSDSFLALGVAPSTANTAYGYIQMGARRAEGLYAVKSFSEKPASDYAKMFVESGEFLWNTGLFLFNARLLPRLIARIDPAMQQYIHALRGQTDFNQWEHQLIEKFYPSNRHNPLDLAILDSPEGVLVRECTFGWADIGSWPELHHSVAHDADGNAVLHKGRAVFSGAAGNLVSLPEGYVAAIDGLEGYLVALSGKTLVVCPNSDPALARRLANEVQMRLGDEFA